MGEMFLKSFHLIVSFARAVMFTIWNSTTGNSTASRILIQCFLRLLTLRKSLVFDFIKEDCLIIYSFMCSEAHFISRTYPLSTARRIMVTVYIKGIN